jgi:hypothetical protein
LLALNLPQTPQINENGPPVSEEPALAPDLSGSLAAFSIENAQLSADRGFEVAGNSRPPVVDSVVVNKGNQGEVIITARILDDGSLAQVKLLGFPPGFTISDAPGGEHQMVTPIVLTLTPLAGQSDIYSLTTAGFTEQGMYRLYWFVTDDEGNLSTSPGFGYTNGSKIYLPAVNKQ